MLYAFPLIALGFMVNSIYRRNQSLNTIALNPKHLASEPADVEVLICTGNEDDPLEGRLSASPSFQKIPGKNRFQELWVVKCINGKFSKFPKLQILLIFTQSNFKKPMGIVDHG